jgi:hypothetical protein
MLESEREELLSAYLDGEVSPDERALVEQWLAESAELRQLRDELLSLRAELKALPRHELKQSLAAAVLAPQTPPDSESSRSELGKLGSAVSTRVAQWWSRGSAAHRFFWPAVAVAAALAILIFDANQRTEELQVAQAPEVAAEAAGAADERAEAADTTLGDSAASDQRSGGNALPAAPKAVPLRRQNFSDVEANSPVPPAGSLSDAGQISASPESSENMPQADGYSRGATPRQAQLQVAVPFGKRAAEDGSQTHLGQDMRQVASDSANLSPAGPMSAGPRALVCEVPTEYLRENRFDQLLASNQITFHRVPLAAADAEKRRFYFQPAAGNQQTLYLIDASPELIDKLLATLPQASVHKQGERQRVSRLELPRMTQPPAEPPGQAGVHVLLVAPRTEQGSAAASPAPASSSANPSNK